MTCRTECFAQREEGKTSSEPTIVSIDASNIEREDE